MDVDRVVVNTASPHCFNDVVLSAIEVIDDAAETTCEVQGDARGDDGAGLDSVENCNIADKHKQIVKSLSHLRSDAGSLRKQLIVKIEESEGQSHFIEDFESGFDSGRIIRSELRDSTSVACSQEVKHQLTSINTRQAAQINREALLLLRTKGLTTSS